MLSETSQLSKSLTNKSKAHVQRGLYSIYNYWGSILEGYRGGIVLPVFANVKGYLPISRKVALNLSWDLGAAIGIGGYFNEGTEFYTSIGPGVTFGRQSGGVQGDFSIRFQHMGEGLNAILFRIGIGF